MRYYNENTEYVKTERLTRAPFGYSRDKDQILYNPNHQDYGSYDFKVVNTHELAHRYDELSATPSREDPDFDKALTSAQEYVKKNIEEIHTYLAAKEISEYFSDVLSAAGVNEKYLETFHTQEYWNIPGNRNSEAFANTFSLAAIESEDLQTLKLWFPELWEAVNKKVEAGV